MNAFAYLLSLGFKQGSLLPRRGGGEAFDRPGSRVARARSRPRDGAARPGLLSWDRLRA